MKLLHHISGPRYLFDTRPTCGVTYLVIEDGHWFEEEVIYDHYVDAVADIDHLKTYNNPLELDFSDEDFYDDDVTEAQEWEDYDPDC